MRSFLALRRISICGGALLLALGATVAGVSDSSAASTSRLTWVTLGDDGFYNYDFNSRRAASNDVDFPVTIFFTNNATVDRAKSKMDAWSTRFRVSSWTSKYMYANDATGAVWDDDGGKKYPMCPAIGVSAPHYRVYGFGSGERLYNTTLGYWVPATTHRDYNECPSIGTRFADSEATEDLMIAETSDNTSVASDYWNIYNNEPLRVEGNHTWSNNGWASTISIP